MLQTGVIMEKELQEQEILFECENEIVTIGDTYRYILSLFGNADIFFGHGADDPVTEAKLLLAPVLKLDFDELKELFNCKLTKRERLEIANLVNKRIFERVPTAYLTNWSWFCGHRFYVDERVIIPRSPIAELITDRFSKFLTKKPNNILDLCTGSGCIAISIALAFNCEVCVDAIDVSYDAIDVCNINVSNYSLQDVVYPIQSDLYTEVEGMKYDLIVCNPPYVSEEDLQNMPEEFDHEPEIALGSGQDGLDLVRKILKESAKHLNDDGLLICEVGNSMDNLISAFPTINFDWISFNNGGMGVFAISKKQLIDNKNLF